MNDYYSGENAFNRHFKKNHETINRLKESVKRLFALFTEFQSDEIIDTWCGELKDFDKKTVDEAVTALYGSHTKMPNCNHLKEKCLELKPRYDKIEQERREKEELKQIESERKQYHALRSAYIAACEKKGVDPEESLAQLVKKWFRAEFGAEPVFENYGLTLRLYEQCALFDLQKAKRLNNKEEV